MTTVLRCRARFVKQFGFGAWVLLVASGACSASSTAAISGVVRDMQGVAQLGAMVQVLTAGSVSVATAFTDLNGRYRIASLVPGSYQVRATSALYVPATRRNLRLSTGMLATINLTLTTLADPAVWLPAERRQPDEPGDDWTWTLRSAANRPILRMLGDGEIVPVDSEYRERQPIHARMAVFDGQGFAQGGLHAAVTAERAGAGGSDVMIRTSVGSDNSRVSDNGTGSAAPGGSEASTDLAAGYQRTSEFAGSYRMTLGYATHPELFIGGKSGMQVMRMASARKMHLGDSVDVEAGGTVYAIHTSGTAWTSQPFFEVTVHPGEVWAVRYSLATSPEVQNFDGLDSLATELPVRAMSAGRLETEHGMHQQIAVSRRLGGGVVQAAVFHDAIDHPAIAGGGAISPAESGEVVMDTHTDSFRFLGTGYFATGASILVSEPLTSSLQATFELESGSALGTSRAEPEGLKQAAAGLHAETAEALTASIKGKVPRTGTWARASYRWQPQHLVTAVDSYGGGNAYGYLSFYVRQSVRWGDRLPPGLEATIDVTNLLAEGYQPFLSADGRTLFLAESPRTLQAGLSFSF